MGASQADVADALGVTRAAVGQWERGDSFPSASRLMAICQFLGLDLSQLLRDGGVSPNIIPGSGTVYGKDEENEVSLDADIRHPHDLFVFSDSRHIPILTMNWVSPDGDYTVEWKAQELALRPESLSRANSAYALYVETDVMAPRYEIGEMIVIAPTRPAGNGDFIAVETSLKHGGRPLWRLGKLIQRRAEAIRLEQFAPHRTVEMSKAEVSSIHRIVPTNELL